MGIIKDHGIIKTLKNGDLRNDPEVLDYVCKVIKGFDDDVDKLGGIEAHSPETDEALENLAAAIIRAEEVDPDEEDEVLDEEDEEENEDLDDDDLIDDDDDEERE